MKDKQKQEKKDIKATSLQGDCQTS